MTKTASKYAGMKRNETSKLIACKLTTHEIELAGKNLASTVGDILKVKEKMSLSNKGFKKEIEELTTQQREFAHMVEAGVEDRQVKCEEIFDKTAGTVLLVRCDDGEMISSRAMTDAERDVPIE